MNEHMQYKYCRYNISRPPIISNIFFLKKGAQHQKHKAHFSWCPTFADFTL